MVETFRKSDQKKPDRNYKDRMIPLRAAAGKLPELVRGAGT
jgi:hypothetical protein